jgi:Ulp1 family protease
VVYEKDQNFLIEQVKEKVKENYKNVKRWTRKIDIFDKDILVFPINAFKHWFCLLVLNPKYLLTPTNPIAKCELIYCDSML